METVNIIKKISLSENDTQELARALTNSVSQTDDLFDYRNIVIQKPWGYEYLIFQNRDTAVWALHMKKGFRTSIHCHPNKKTSLTVLAGEARCLNLNDGYLVRAGEGLLIDKGVFHCTHALAPDWVILMEVETPVNKQDLVRLHDAYGRAGMRYEGSEYHVDAGNTLCHFHSDNERYYCEKRLGDCNLMVMKYHGDSDFRKAQETTEADLAAVLAGGLRNGNGEIGLGVGDIASWKEIRANGYAIEPDTEILFIKKVV